MSDTVTELLAQVVAASLAEAATVTAPAQVSAGVVVGVINTLFPGRGAAQRVTDVMNKLSREVDKGAAAYTEQVSAADVFTDYAS